MAKGSNRWPRKQRVAKKATIANCLNPEVPISPFGQVPIGPLWALETFCRPYLALCGTHWHCVGLCGPCPWPPAPGPVPKIQSRPLSRPGWPGWPGGRDSGRLKLSKVASELPILEAAAAAAAAAAARNTNFYAPPSVDPFRTAPDTCGITMSS